MFPRKSLIAFAVAVGAFSSAEVLAHATYVPKDNYVTRDGRSYLEGKNSELNLNLAHACSADTGTVIATTVFPNGNDTEVYDLKLERQPDGSLKVTQDPMFSTSNLSDAIDGDPLSSIKPRVDGDWQEITLKKDEKGKLRGIHWHGGWVPDAFYERVAFRATFAKFKPDSCVSKVRVYLPAIQYCGKLTSPGKPPVIGIDYPPFVAQDYWLWRAVPEAGVQSIATGSDGKPVTVDLGRAPYIDIDRDPENNELPKGCKNHDGQNGKGTKEWKGQVIGVYPGVDTIKSFLIHGDGGSSGGGNTSLVCADGKPANPPDHITHHEPWCTDGSTPK